jgi:membrane dipeptidase
MKIKFFIISILLTQQINAQSYRKIHAKAIVIDTHNDFLMEVTDKLW